VPSAILYVPGDIHTLASQLAVFERDRSVLVRAKESALEAARTRWNWEAESTRLIELVATSLSKPPRSRGVTASRNGVTADYRHRFVHHGIKRSPEAARGLRD